MYTDTQIEHAYRILYPGNLNDPIEKKRIVARNRSDVANLIDWLTANDIVPDTPLGSPGNPVIGVPPPEGMEWIPVPSTVVPAVPTLQMIEAGQNILLEQFAGCVPHHWSASDVATDVYIAMVSA